MPIAIEGIRIFSDGRESANIATGEQFALSRRMYRKRDVVWSKENSHLPIILAGKSFDLPIMSAPNGALFAWLNPSADPLKRACALEVGYRLRQAMPDGGIVLKAPSGKSAAMSDEGIQVATGLGVPQIIAIQLGGGTKEELKKQGIFSDETLEDFFNGKIDDAPFKVYTNKSSQAVYARRYQPVTGKDKVLFISEEQAEVVYNGVVYGKMPKVIVEDVVTTGTTVTAVDDVVHTANLGQISSVVAVATEGGQFRGRPCKIDFAVHLPAL